MSFPNKCAECVWEHRCLHQRPFWCLQGFLQGDGWAGTMGDGSLPVHKPGSNWTEVRLLPCRAQQSHIHWGHLPEGSGKKIKPLLPLCFFKQAPGFLLLPFQHSYNYLQNFLRPVTCAHARFYMDVFETECCPTGSRPSWSHFPAGRAQWAAEVEREPLPLCCWYC